QHRTTRPGHAVEEGRGASHRGSLGRGRGDGRQLEMPHETRDHRLLGDDRNEVQRAPAAQRTGAHLQPKDAAQQSGPRPVWGGRLRLLPVYPVWSKNSCSVAHVVFQEPPKPFATLDWACTLCVGAGRREEQDITLALMIPLMMEMLHVWCQRMMERCFPDQD